MRPAVLRLEPARSASVLVVELAEPALERALLGLGQALEPTQCEQLACVLVK